MFKNRYAPRYHGHPLMFVVNIDKFTDQHHGILFDVQIF